jgi:hypothetical protein
MKSGRVVAPSVEPGLLLYLLPEYEKAATGCE